MSLDPDKRYAKGKPTHWSESAPSIPSVAVNRNGEMPKAVIKEITPAKPTISAKPTLTPKVGDNSTFFNTIKVYSILIYCDLKC